LDNKKKKSDDHDARSFAFFKEKRFWISAGIMFSYLCIEASVIGWIVSYFIDTGSIDVQLAQWLTVFLWFSMLIGRLICSVFANKISISRLLICLSAGVAAFYGLLMFDSRKTLLLTAAVGLGLCMSGIYATTVANVGCILKKYPLSMGFFMTITGIGAIIMPMTVGIIADEQGIQNGMKLIIFNVVLLLGFALWNVLYCRKQSLCSE
jgi:fucose permease